MKKIAIGIISLVLLTSCARTSITQDLAGRVDYSKEVKYLKVPLSQKKEALYIVTGEMMEEETEEPEQEETEAPTADEEVSEPEKNEKPVEQEAPATQPAAGIYREEHRAWEEPATEETEATEEEEAGAAVLPED